MSSKRVRAEDERCSAPGLVSRSDLLSEIDEVIWEADQPLDTTLLGCLWDRLFPGEDLDDELVKLEKDQTSGEGAGNSNARDPGGEADRWESDPDLSASPVGGVNPSSVDVSRVDEKWTIEECDNCDGECK